MPLAAIYLETVIKRFSFYKDLGDKALAQLPDAELYTVPAEGSNSIAIMIQHMVGNMLSRFTDFLNTDGEKPWRNRDAEFESSGMSRQQLMELWEKGWHRFFTTLQSLNPDDLLLTVTIREEKLYAVDAINRQLAHYSYHIGQIIFLAKFIKGDQWINLSIPKADLDLLKTKNNPS